MPNDEYKGEARDERLQGPMTVQKKELEHVRKKMTADARDKCHETRAAYVECAKGRTISIPFFCRTLFKEFNACLSQHTSDDELERRLEQYRATKPAQAMVVPSSVQPSDVMVTPKGKAS